MDLRITIKRPKSTDMLFWAAYGLYLIIEILSLSFYSRYLGETTVSVIRFLCLGLLILRELITQKYSIRSFVIGVIIIALAILTYTHTSTSSLAFMLIFIFCARNLTFESIARFSVWLISILLIFVILSSFLGIISNYSQVSTTRTRTYLGFRYSLYAPALLFNITGLYLYLKKSKKIRWIELLVLLLINFWMYVQTATRVSFYLSLILIFVFAIFKISPNFFNQKHVLCWIMIFSFLIAIAISFFLTLSYNKSIGWLNDLDKFLEHRLRYGQNSLISYGITLWGQNFSLVGHSLDEFGNSRIIESYLYVDNYYIQTFQRYGVVFSVLWFGAITFVMYRLYKTKNYTLLVCFTVIAFRLMIDDTFGKLYYNTFWFAIIILIQERQNNKKILKTESTNTIVCQKNRT